MGGSGRHGAEMREAIAGRCIDRTGLAVFDAMDAIDREAAFQVRAGIDAGVSDSRAGASCAREVTSSFW
jgi:hypothetical protein